MERLDLSRPAFETQATRRIVDMLSLLYSRSRSHIQHAAVNRGTSRDGGSASLLLNGTLSPVPRIPFDDYCGNAPYVSFTVDSLDQAKAVVLVVNYLS